MAYPVSSEFIKALKSPLKDVTMRCYILRQTTDPSVSQTQFPNVEFAYLGPASDATGNTSPTNNGVTFDATTKFCPASDTGMEFDGSTDYFTIAGIGTITDRFTVGFWAELDLEKTQYVMKQTSGLSINFDASGYLLVRNNGAVAWQSDDVYKDRLAHFYVITKQTGSSVEVYVDGFKVDGADSGATFTSNSNVVYVGSDTGPGNYLDGKIDELVMTSQHMDREMVLKWYDSMYYKGDLRQVYEVDDVLEGTVYVDAERKNRRTAQIRVVNNEGKWTPTTQEDAFYWDSTFGLEYGLRVGDEYEYVPLGSFMVDRWEVLAENDASVLNVDGIDFWYKFIESEYPLPKAYFTNTSYNAIITDMANAAGIYKFNLDPLDHRAATERQIQTPLYFEIEENRGDKLYELCEEWGLDIWFDVDGTLTTRDKLLREDTLKNSDPVWVLTGGEDAVFVNVTKSQTPDDIYNHIVAVGESDDGNALVVAEAIDGIGTSVTGKSFTNDTTSALRVERIGDRVKMIRSTQWRTTAAAQIAADAELNKGSTVSEEVRIPTTVLPHIDGFDVIEIIEDKFTRTNDKYFIKRFDIPMRSGSQQELTVTTKRAV